MKQKKFEDFISDECESCQHYWNSTCDGKVDGADCNSYEATNMSLIEEQLHRIERNQWLTTIVLVLMALAEIIEIGKRFF